MMDYQLMEKTIATVLGISMHTITDWSVTTTATRCGMITNSMTVNVAWSPALQVALIEWQHKELGSIKIADLSRTMYSDLYGEGANLEIVLLVGKETARIFHVLAMLMQYRKPKKRKKHAKVRKNP